jgi:adenylate cyclase class IV
VRKELKIQIDDVEAVEKRLQELGAKFTGGSIHQYTYFNQPEGNVLKVTQTDTDNFLSQLELQNNMFSIVPEKSINHEKIEELKKKYGVKKHLTNIRRFYDYKDNLISVNLIDDVGQFLIIESENPSLELAKKIAGTDNPKIITASFDNL